MVQTVFGSLDFSTSDLPYQYHNDVQPLKNSHWPILRLLEDSVDPNYLKSLVIIHSDYLLIVRAYSPDNLLLQSHRQMRGQQVLVPMRRIVSSLNIHPNLVVLRLSHPVKEF